MILSDNETKVDLLNSEAIAKTIAKLITDRPDHPVTIGVHGDWGAGKSSVLEMIESELEIQKDIVIIKFNGWRFQGFEDAKISLIEGIVTQLVEKRSLWTKAKDEVTDIYKRIDWLKVAKKAGGLAFTVATGLPSGGTIKSIITGLQKLGNSAIEGSSKDDINEMIESAGSLLKEKQDKKVSNEIREFQKDFDKLLKKAQIKQLIVLVDDLDRCLPETAIETLEAIRLFLFTTQTAFVVAADEAMIEYAVKRHFPDFENTTGSQTYSRNYLEKLIQIPFRIPVLGETETKIYVTLLLIGTELGDNDEGFKKLIAEARKKLLKPWESAPIDSSTLRDIFGAGASKLQNALILSDQIGPVLASGTKGNPRQIKRFLNTLLLRQKTAEARGFGQNIALPVLAKLMIAERFLPNRFFETLASSAANHSKGKCAEISQLETNLALDKTKSSSSDAQPKKLPSEKSTERLVVEWEGDQAIKEWALMSPKLSDVDLRPYIFISKDKKDFFSASVNLGQLTALTDQLYNASKFTVSSLEVTIQNLSIEQAKSIFSAIRGRIVNTDDFTKMPQGIPGLGFIVKCHNQLQPDLVDMLEGLPKQKTGPWVLTGWDNIIIGTDEKQRLSKLITSWSKNSNTALKIASAEALKLKSK